MAARPPANGFVAVARKVYNPIGFTKGYNFVLFFIFGGALMGFTLARLQFLAVDTSCSGGSSDQPLDCYYYTQGSVDRIGIILHLATILPAAFLACLQFVPFIRRTFVLFHRINGYLIIFLSLVSTAGVLMLAKNAVGGWLEVQIGIGVLSIAFLGSLALALYNIKRLQIEQHRAWMLRAWFYQRTLASYPECEAYFSHQDPNKVVVVPATMDGNYSNVIAIMNFGFGAAFWLAFTLHAFGVEVYLRLTPAEAERLRNVSYQRQLEAGMSSPGRAGLTADKIGDSSLWVPLAQREPADDSDGASKKVDGMEGGSGDV
ncbi:hypothetical protein C8A00DRAFT_18952 [Chaetomidium leptoderma]|uniref:Uncharacterized protein n=1 Tax=Chaetomidium leptoderma TaxID=669021 RepID=A0AAN6ZUF6_9PEZI|nr:hypothetical protein C8A00DRAFT_18952 [Chaetomidium leptoderma]